MATYSLPDLPYDYSALAPAISGEILELHHDKHHAAYVKGANDTLDQLAEARDKGAFGGIVGLEKSFAFNLSGHVLHSIFWENLSPDGGDRPDGELAAAIEDNFGRVRDVRFGPRTLDIDVIMVGKRISEDNIELPHPRAHERAFVLVPWLDIDPKGEIAGHGPIAELIDDVDVSGVVRRADIVINANTGF